MPLKSFISRVDYEQFHGNALYKEVFNNLDLARLLRLAVVLTGPLKRTVNFGNFFTYLLSGEGIAPASTPLRGATGGLGQGFDLPEFFSWRDVFGLVLIVSISARTLGTPYNKYYDSVGWVPLG